MKQAFKLFIQQIMETFHLSHEPSSKERLRFLIEEYKHLTLEQRITAIRTNSDYVPNYNRPKVFTDIVNCINENTKLAVERPVDFKGNIGAWKKNVRRDHKKEVQQKKLLELQEKQRKELFDTVVNPFFMKRFTEGEDILFLLESNL
jgi:hypothetical protein